MRSVALTLAILLTCIGNFCFAQCSSLGDVNQDGVVNLLDVDPFIAVLGSGEYQYEADCNEDGVVNLLDVDPFIEILAGGPPTNTVVLRESIGVDSSLTDGNPGASTGHDGGTWTTPAFVIHTPETGQLNGLKFVMFARGIGDEPENDIANIYGYPMELNIWSDGIQGGLDSFYENAVGANVPGHIKVDVNSFQGPNFITVDDFGTTGPPSDPTMFTTFLITVDLSCFDIELLGGQEYVLAIIQNNAGNFISGDGFFRLSYSLSTGPEEDLYQQFDTPTDLLPGFVNSQHGFGFEQYGVRVTLEVPAK